jgi:hypothetical protein
MRLSRDVGLIIVAWSDRTVSRRRDANADVPAISLGRARHSYRAATIGACDQNLNEQPFWIVSFTRSCRLPNGNGREMTASSVVRPRMSPIVTFTYRVGHNSPRRLTNNSSGSKA